MEKPGPAGTIAETGENAVAGMETFQAIAEGRGGQLLAAAFEFARDRYPGFEVASGLASVQNLAAGLDLFRAVRGTGDAPAELLATLNDYFFQELRFRGAEDPGYYDPRNSYLNEVLERRVGIPISLCALYRELARSVGLELCGVNLPGHFMLAYPVRSAERIYIDVYRGGAMFAWPECLRRLRAELGGTLRLAESEFPPMTDRDVLARMLRNLKGIYSERDWLQALQVQERLVSLLPGNPAELRDLALLCLRTGNPVRAHRAFAELLRQHPQLERTEFIRDQARLAAREAAQVN